MLDTPPDVMHLFGGGFSRIEPCWMMRILFKEGAKLAVDDPWVKLNQNIETLNRTLPRGKRLPKLYPPRTGKKLKEMHLDLNASETFLFTMQSITLLEPFTLARDSYAIAISDRRGLSELSRGYQRLSDSYLRR